MRKGGLPFWPFNGGSKSAQVLLDGIEAVIGTDFDNPEIANPEKGKDRERERESARARVRQQHFQHDGVLSIAGTPNPSSWGTSDYMTGPQQRTPLKKGFL